MFAAKEPNQMPNDKPIEDTIKEMIVERLFLKVEPDEIPNDANLMKTLDIDSVSVLEIVVGLEETYGITFEDEEFKIETFETVQTISDFVREKLDIA